MGTNVDRMKAFTVVENVETQEALVESERVGVARDGSEIGAVPRCASHQSRGMASVGRF